MEIRILIGVLLVCAVAGKNIYVWKKNC